MIAIADTGVCDEVGESPETRPTLNRVVLNSRSAVSGTQSSRGATEAPSGEVEFDEVSSVEFPNRGDDLGKMTLQLRPTRRPKSQNRYPPSNQILLLLQALIGRNEDVK